MPKSFSRRTITVFGGTGYLGRRIVHSLAENEFHVRVAVRHPRSDLFQHMGDSVEQIRADVVDANSVACALQNAYGVVNSVSLYCETKTSSFSSVHIDGARNIAAQSIASKAQLVHVSGIGANPDSESRYVAARGAGEEAVCKIAPDTVVLRPSVLFGPDDAFLGSLSTLARLSLFVPLFGNGSTRLQPVHVEDVAEAVVRVLMTSSTRGNTYELGGPYVYTYRELLGDIVKQLGRKRIFLPVPFPIWKLLAAVCELLPSPPLTRDQVILMSDDNVINPGKKSFKELGVYPQPLEKTLARMS